MRNGQESKKKSQSAEADIEMQQWQVEHLEASITQADAGKFISHEEVRRMAAKWRSQQ